MLLRLIKNQTKFEIREQKAEIIYNVAGDIVIHNPITREAVIIPSIQSVLKKDEISEGEFFRKKPVAWVDFEQGFIVERKEVNEIIKRLVSNNFHNNVQLVLGAPASGKTIILKNVGYKLSNDGKKNVHIVELKRHPIDEVKLFFENIPKIDDNNQIFIIDDAHLYLSNCERLAKEFKSKGKGNLIIGSRETREITEEHPKDGAEYELLSELSKTCIHIQAEDVTEKMIRTFLEKQYHFDEDKIKIVSSNLDKYKNDLWLLSWALKAYYKDKESVNIDEIYEKIARSIEEIKVGTDKEAINAEDVFLPLSVFFRFEIPIERNFLEEQLNIDKTTIKQLIGLQEISETKEAGHKMLSMHHSSIAELYLGAYLRESDLGRRIKKKILNGKDEADLEYCSFYQYITTTDPRNSVNVVLSLDRDYFDEKGGRKLIRKLIEEDKIQFLIKNGIDEEEDIVKNGLCISGIAEASEEVAMKLLESVSSKINKEEDIVKIGSCLLDIKLRNEDTGQKLVDNIDIHFLSSKIDKEENIEKVRSCILSIAEASHEVGKKLANCIDINALSSKINKEEDIGKIGECVRGITGANMKVGLKLVSSINFDALLSKIEEEDIGKMGECVSGITEANMEVGLKLVSSINFDALLSKIEKEEDIGKIGWFVRCIIAYTNEEVKLKLVDSVLSKIEKEKDIEKIGRCVGIIADKSEEVGLKLVESVVTKIDKEEDIKKIGECVGSIGSGARKKVSLKLANSINIDALLSKLEKEEDREKIEACVKDIEKANKEKATEIVNRLSPKLREELQKRMDRKGWKVGRGFFTIGSLHK